MSNDTVVSLAAPAPVSDPLTELLRSGARRLIEGRGLAQDCACPNGAIRTLLCASDTVLFVGYG